MFVVIVPLLILLLRLLVWLADRAGSIRPVLRVHRPSAPEAPPQQQPLAAIHAPTPRLTI